MLTPGMANRLNMEVHAALMHVMPLLSPGARRCLAGALPARQRLLSSAMQWRQAEHELAAVQARGACAHMNKPATAWKLCNIHCADACSARSTPTSERWPGHPAVRVPRRTADLHSAACCIPQSTLRPRRQQAVRRAAAAGRAEPWPFKLGSCRSPSDGHTGTAGCVYGYPITR